jgi:hypothetical protein
VAPAVAVRRPAPAPPLTSTSFRAPRCIRRLRPRRSRIFQARRRRTSRPRSRLLRRASLRRRRGRPRRRSRRLSRLLPRNARPASSTADRAQGIPSPCREREFPRANKQEWLNAVRGRTRLRDQSTIRKSGSRFSEKIVLHLKSSTIRKSGSWFFEKIVLHLKSSTIRKKPAPDVIRGGNRLSGKIVLHQKS